MALTADKIIPTMQSTSEEWIAWYKLLPGSKNTRNALFLQIWKTRGTSKANTNDLRVFMRDQGIDITTNGVGNYIDAALDFKDWFVDFFKIGAITTAVLGVIVIGGAVLIIKGLATPENIGTAARLYSSRKP